MNNNLENIITLIGNRHFIKAKTKLSKLLKKHPQEPEYLRLMGVVALQLGDVKNAEKYFLKSYKLKPHSIPVLLNLASLYKLQLNYQKAIELVKTALKIDPYSIPSLYNFANILRSNAQYEEAEILYNQVLKSNPNHYGSLIHLGHINKNNANIEKASHYYLRVLAINPNDTNMYLALANLKRYRFSKDEISYIERLLDSKDNKINKTPLLFAKTKILEDQDKFPESYKYLSEGNKKRYNSLNRKPFDWNKYSNDIISTFDQDFIEANSQSGNPSNSPIFIVSMPRAGSTLIEQILASHSQVNGAAELPYIPSLIKKQSQNEKYPFSFSKVPKKLFKEIGDEYIELSKRWRTETPFFTDKLPNNLTYLGVILLSMPNAKIIYSVRDPIDVTLSCYRQLFAKGNEFSFDLKELVQYYQHHINMMNHWNKLFPNRILKINYEELVTHTEKNIKKILKHCHLNWEESCLNFHKTKRNIRTASAGQVSEKINNKAIDRYKKYGKSIEELLNLLSNVKSLEF